MGNQNHGAFRSYRATMLSCIIPLVVFFVGLYGVTGYKLYHGWQIREQGIPVTCTVGYGDPASRPVIIHYAQDDDSMVTYQVGDTIYGCGISAYVGEEGNTVELRYMPGEPERIWDYEHELGTGKLLLAVSVYISIMCAIVWLAADMILKRKRKKIHPGN